MRSELAPPVGKPDSATAQKSPLFAICLALWGTLTLVCWGMLRDGPLINTGNLHDLWIPYNAALALKENLPLHEGLFTPFGWIYAWLNEAAWRTIDVAGIELNNLITVSSVLWTAGLIGVAALFLTLWPSSQLPPRQHRWLIMTLIIFTVFSFKGDNLFELTPVNWYGIYNNHLWGLILFQLMVLGIQMRASALSDRMTFMLAITHALVIYVSSNYKVSFGLTACMLALISLLTLKHWRQAGIYIMVGLITVASLLAVTAAAGYDYSKYLAAIGSALKAKSEAERKVYWEMVLGGVGFAAAWTFWAPRRAIHTPATWRAGMEGLLLAGALYLSVAGDFSRPWLLYPASLFVLLASTRHVTSQGIAKDGLFTLTRVAVGLMIFSSLFTSMRIAWAKYEPLSPARKRDVSFSTPYGELRWRIPAKKLHGERLQAFKVVSHPQFRQIQLEIAYTTPEGIKANLYNASNSDYSDSIFLAQQYLKERGQFGRHAGRPLLLEFSNPLPLLTGAFLPDPTPHWIHYGTSMAMFDDDPTLFRTLENSATLIVPIVSVNRMTHPLLLCKFFEWNRKAGFPFQLRKIDTHNLYYERASGARLPHEFVHQLSSRCQATISAFQTGRLSAN